MRFWASLVAAVVVCLFLVSSPCQGATIYACKKKIGGTIRIVRETTRCYATETRISWNTVGPQGPQGEPGPPGEGNLKVLDGSNQFLGYLLGMQSPTARQYVELFVPSLQRIATLDLYEGNVDGGQAQAQAAVFFSEQNCAGIMMMQTPTMHILTFTKRPLPWVLIMWDGNSPSSNCTYLSEWAGDYGCRNYDPPPDLGRCWIYTPVTFPFTTPVTLPIRIQGN